MLEEPNYTKQITTKLNLKETQVTNLLNLIEDKNTVPFIARYRKEVTLNLDENSIREILEYKTKLENLYNAKRIAINAIKEQNKLTPELETTIINAKTLKDVEDIYAPYKIKRKTKAMIAKEKGFEIISNQILAQHNITIPEDLLKQYSKEEIIQGAQDIIIEDIALSPKNKQDFRNYFTKYGEIITKHKTKLDELHEKTQKQIHKFEIYKNFTQEVSRLKSYQILAINRGEDLKILNAKLEKDEIIQENLEELYIKSNTNKEPLKMCIKEAYKKLFKSTQTEIRTTLTKKAEIDAIESFQKNLNKLLLTKPQYNKSLLAIDPGFRTGCKIAIIDQNNKPQEFNKIYLHKSQEAINIITNIIKTHDPQVIVIGNGTGSNQTHDLLKDKFSLPIYIVNESGASIYSTSNIANEEFPNLDLTDRGTISIGRRFIDPLAELVKIPPHNIGVGMYQHDMNQKELETKLNYVIEDVVNMVGININTASPYILAHISGLTKKSAKKLHNSSPYNSRKELKKILTPKAFQQAAGFLRIPNSKEELDNTNIHPEQYKLAKYIIKNKITNFKENETKLKELYNTTNQTTIDDISKAYTNIRKDPRIYDAILKIKKTLQVEDLKEGDVVTGIVRNIMQFGAFVDIGLKNDALIHISQLANKFVKDPNDIVQIGEEVKGKITKIDLTNSKINISLKDM